MSVRPIAGGAARRDPGTPRPHRPGQFAEISLIVPDPNACLRVHNSDLGNAIRALRKTHGLTIEALAMDAGMHPIYLSGIERGVRNPTWDKLADLAEALEVPVSAIVLGAEERCVQEAIRMAAADAYRVALKPSCRPAG